MFDISWSELLILGIVTLVFVGPKELPVFLRTIGRYAGMVKRQAGEFREQFDTAMREAELDQIRKDMMGMKGDVENSLRDAERSAQSEFDRMKDEFDQLGTESSPSSTAPDPDAHDADGLPIAGPASTITETSPAKPVSKAEMAALEATAAAKAHNPPPAAPPPQTPEAMKSGV